MHQCIKIFIVFLWTFLGIQVLEAGEGNGLPRGYALSLVEEGIVPPSPTIVDASCSERRAGVTLQGVFLGYLDYQQIAFFHSFFGRADEMCVSPVSCIAQHTDMRFSATTGEYVDVPDIDVHFKVALVKINPLLFNAEGQLSVDVAQWMTHLEISGNGISSLRYIEYFKNLTSLRCSDNHLTSLDIRQNTRLVRLYCYNNLLTSLDVSQNTELVYLDCHDNQIASLDVSRNSVLGDLVCSSNQLSSLDVSRNTNLDLLDCSKNKLRRLDLYDNALLGELVCYDNPLTSLDLRNKPSLRVMYIVSGGVTGTSSAVSISEIKIDALLGCSSEIVKIWDAYHALPHFIMEAYSPSGVLLSTTQNNSTFKPCIQIIFNSSGGSRVPSQTIRIGAQVVPPNDPMRDGYMFKGWYTNAQYSSAYVFSREVREDLTLYAKWTHPTYTVTFNVGGGTPAISTQYIKRGDRVSNPSMPSKRGYAFLGWYERNPCRGCPPYSKLYNFDMPVERNMTLEASWGASSSNSADSSKYPTEVKRNRSVVQLKPDVSGYLENGGIKRKLVSRSECKIFLSANGGSLNGPSKIAIDCGMVIGNFYSSVPTRDGYVFVGWGVAGTGTLLDKRSSVNQDMLLTAKWGTTYTIRYLLDVGGSDYASASYTLGQSISYPGTPTKVGHDFVEWRELGKREAFMFDIPNYTIRLAETQVVAKWKKKRYRVTFDANGGYPNGCAMVAYEEEPPYYYPSRKGYVFTQWIAGDGYRLEGRGIVEDITLKATWCIEPEQPDFSKKSLHEGMDFFMPTPCASPVYPYANANKLVATKMKSIEEDDGFKGILSSLDKPGNKNKKEKKEDEDDVSPKPCN